MPRVARLILPGLPYHVTQRGNNQEVIFHDDADRRHYLYLVEKYRQKALLKFLGYCLMNNHVHFIVIPLQEDSLRKCFSITHMCYAQYFNRKVNRSGHLWQGRFFSCPMDEVHLYMALRYVERNPVRAGKVEKAWAWTWSSAFEHIQGRSQSKGIVTLDNVDGYIQIGDWKEYLLEGDDESDIEKLRFYTKTGRLLSRDSK